jgi:hypothetical protein
VHLSGQDLEKATSYLVSVGVKMIVGHHGHYLSSALDIGMNIVQVIVILD